MPTTEDIVLNQERKIKMLESLLNKSHFERLMLEDRLFKMSQKLSDNSYLKSCNNGLDFENPNCKSNHSTTFDDETRPSSNQNELKMECKLIQKENKIKDNRSNVENKNKVQIKEDLGVIETLSEQSDVLEECMRNVTREFDKYLTRQKEVAKIKNRYIEKAAHFPNYTMVVSELHLLIRDGFSSVKQHVQDMFKLVNPDLLDAVSAHRSDLKKMMLRSNYLEIKVKNLEKSLESKEAECNELNALCENVTSKLAVYKICSADDF